MRRLACVTAIAMAMMLLAALPSAADAADADLVCAIGDPPFSREFLKQELSAFVPVFLRRPGGRNAGGTELFHAFALWATLRWFKPAHIIESGAFLGLGTWLLRQAAPTAQGGQGLAQTKDFRIRNETRHGGRGWRPSG